MTRHETPPEPARTGPRAASNAGGNRAQRRARGWRDPVTKRLLVEPTRNVPYRKDEEQQ